MYALYNHLDKLDKLELRDCLKIEIQTKNAETFVKRAPMKWKYTFL